MKDIRGSPPLTRGKEDLECVRCEVKRITPAYAGKSLRRPPCAPQDWDHPRLRGEKSFRHHLVMYIVGSPPLTRGKAKLSALKNA